MRRNEAAARSILEDQIDETPMEARIARIESDVGHIKVTLAAQAQSIKDIRGDIQDVRSEIKDVRGEMKAANDAIAGIRKDGADQKAEINTLRGEVNTLRAEVKDDINTLREETKAQIHGLEIRLVRWLIGTVITVGSLGFSLAKWLG